MILVRNDMRLWDLTRSSGLTVDTYIWQSQDSNPGLMILSVMVFPSQNKHKAAKFPQASFSTVHPEE